MPHLLGDLPRFFEDEALDTVGIIVEAAPSPDDGRLRLVLGLRDFDELDVSWQVECRGAVAWRLTEEPVIRFEVFDRHPALMPFVDPRADLYLSRPPTDAGQIADRMRTITAEVAQGFINFDDLVNRGYGGLSQLLAAGYGKVASGPITLIEALQDALESDGARTSLLPAGPPTIYDELQMTWAPVPEDLSFLYLGGSWVVAQSLHCTELL